MEQSRQAARKAACYLFHNDDLRFVEFTFHDVFIIASRLIGLGTGLTAKSSAGLTAISISKIKIYVLNDLC